MLMTYQAACAASPRALIEACPAHADAFRAAKAQTRKAEEALKVAHKGVLHGTATMAAYRAAEAACRGAQGSQWMIELVVIVGIHHTNVDVRRTWRMACPR